MPKQWLRCITHLPQDPNTNTHFASMLTAMPNELEVFSYVLANESSAKLWIQICISKYDDSSRQSPNAVTA